MAKTKADALAKAKLRATAAKSKVAKVRKSKAKAKAAPKRTAAKSRPAAKKRAEAAPDGQVSHSRRRRRSALKRPSKATSGAQEPNPFDMPPPEGQQRLAVQGVKAEETGDSDAEKPPRRKRGQLVLQRAKSQQSEQGQGTSAEVKSEEEEPVLAPAPSSPEPRPSMESFLDFQANDELPPSPEKPSLPEATRSRTEMFSYPMRNLERIHKHFGLDPLSRLSRNLSSLSVLSLYSGLGGAEIATSLTTTALRSYVEKNKLESEVGYPTKPRNLLACDFNADCQRVLKAHRDS